MNSVNDISAAVEHRFREFSRYGSFLFAIFAIFAVKALFAKP
jgi:hypothetical protein